MNLIWQSLEACSVTDMEQFRELQKINAEKFKALEGEYKKAFFSVYKPLAADAFAGVEHERAVSDLIDKLLLAQRGHAPISDVFPNGLRQYYNDLLNSLPDEPEKKPQSRKRLVYSAIAIVVITLVVVCAALWQNGSIGVWSHGIQYLYENLDEYSYQCTPVEGTCSVTVDLSNPKSNAGKTLYNKDGCKIEISFMDNAGLSCGGYRIGFRTHGVYSPDSAVLVSGIKHITTEQRSFTTNLTASMKTTYNGITYDCPAFSSSGMVFKDGDEFSFYLFPSEAYNKNQVTLFETGKAQLTISGLVKNYWYRK